jgi:hypothetical protein
VFAIRAQIANGQTRNVRRIGRYFYTSNYLQLPGSRLSSLLAPPGFRSRSIADTRAWDQLRGIPARSHRRKYKFRNIKPRSQPLRGRPSLSCEENDMGAPRFSYRCLFTGTEVFIRNTRTKKSKKGEEDVDSRVSRRLQGPRLEARVLKRTSTPASRGGSRVRVSRQGSRGRLQGAPRGCLAH